MAATLVVAAHLRVSVFSASSVPSVSLNKGPGTSRAELKRSVEEMTARLATHSNDASAVVKLADTLIRLQRVNNDGRAVISAEEHLRVFLKRNGSNYDVERTLTAVLLSQHRFADAIKQAQSLQARDPRDALLREDIGVEPASAPLLWSSRLEYQTRRLFVGESEHEISGKAVGVALNGFVEVASGDAIERRKVTIQHHPLPANQENRLFDLFGLNQRFLVVHGPVHQSVSVWTFQ